MTRFISIPTIVEAVQWRLGTEHPGVCKRERDGAYVVPGPNGTIDLKIGDWIVEEGGHFIVYSSEFFDRQFLPLEDEPRKDHIETDEELLKLCATASPGPWSGGCFASGDDGCTCKHIFDDAHCGGIGQVYVDNGKRIPDGGNDAPKKEEARANLKFIAASRAAVPRLLARATMGEKLARICRAFLDMNKITVPETIYQADRVAENALPFVEEIAETVGYAKK